ncbi:hypothetical protein JTE88_07940 [Arcanobacterium phocisimile]|uniref:SAF domain-containing protein n=1 Tax=Arcanobacterium phocisimile TaxID=1302235 RepID=A0ABX7IFU0_9ACTO|nr:SAF domain-containing protein [Arcanobacterium phocisimile]QRV01998.1 hypothetical protein JTE88_07940 [Arcanobacterium phocisimile]
MPTTIQKYQRLRAAMWRWRWAGITLIAALSIQQVTTALELSHQTPHHTFVASTDLPAGHEITSDDLQTQLVHELLPGMPSDATDLLGLHLLTSVTAGSPITKNQVLSPDFLNQAPPGFVIASVLLADTGGLSMLQTGSYVDLFAPASENFDNRTPEAVLLAQHIRVAGIAHDTGDSNFFRDVPDTTRFFLEIPESAVKVILGAGTHTPLIAVVSRSSQIQ